MDCKIFVSYHKPSVLLKSDVFVPIQVGRAAANLMHKDGKSKDKDLLWLSDNLIGDDTGENISEKNRNYCELTAQFWAWKNVKADYIGFMHYRRHLSFNVNENFAENKWGLIEEEHITSEYINKYNLSDDKIKDFIKDYDLIVAKGWDVRNAGSKNNYDHYKSSDKKLFIKDYDLALKILCEKYPEYSKAAEVYNNSYIGYYTNIFISNYKIFNKYCSMLFDVLFELEKNIDITKYSLEEARVFGYISEWIFGIYVTYLSMQNKVKIKELQRTVVVKPEKNVIRICFSSDDRYAQHLGVTIASVLKNKSEDEDIECYVIDGGISEKNKRNLQSLNKISKFRLKFLNINKKLFKNCPFNFPSHLSYATYYRLIFANLLPDLDKILYLDSDLIVKSSLKELWSTDIEDVYFAGVKDILFKQNAKRLKLKKYCNTGVLLLNLKKLRAKNMSSKFLKYIEYNNDKIVWHDQDVLNSVCKNGIKYLDKKWNAQTGEYPECFSSGFNKNANEAVIVHYIGHLKPWDYKANQPFRHLYFKYLRLTKWKGFYFLWTFKRFTRKVLKNIFSISNKNAHKIVKVLGFKFKLKSNTLILKRNNEILENRISILEKKLNIACKDINRRISRLEKEHLESKSMRARELLEV